MCRSGKINCQLVGRAWYVSEDSLRIHKEGTYGTARPNPRKTNNKAIDYSTPPPVVATEVRPVLTKGAIKSLFRAAQAETKQYHTTTQYLPDEVELLPRPQVAKTAIPTADITDNEAFTVPVQVSPVANQDTQNTPDEIEEEPVKTTRIAIKTQSKQKNIAFTNLPEIPLKGAIKVVQVKPQKPTIKTKTKPSKPDLDSMPSRLDNSMKSLSRAPVQKPLNPDIRAETNVSESAVTFSPQSVRAVATTPEAAVELTSRKSGTVIFLGLTLLFMTLFFIVSFFGVLHIVTDNVSAETTTFFRLDFRSIYAQ